MPSDSGAQSKPVEVFTTSNILLQALVDAGIKRAFVNLGSDHPALLEAFASRKKYGLESLEIVTCPNEMVGLSAAQGYAQVCGLPAAVIVHVDCGTQALAGAVHNASTSRTPVFIYAGASPYTENGELQGSRNEFIHWLQNATDQPAIVRQYMRHVGEIRSGTNAPQVVHRALQFANSEPKGPVYVWAQREATEEFMDPNKVADVRAKEIWSPIELNQLNKPAVQRIGDAFLKAKSPLIVTSYLGRNPAAVDLLRSFVELLAVPVLQTGVSNVNLPFTHPCHTGIQFSGPAPIVEESDVILILDSDVPWLPMKTKPRKDATIFHLDVDPLKERMAFATYPAVLRAKVDGALALEQLIDYVSASPSLAGAQKTISSRLEALTEKKKETVKHLRSLEVAAEGDILTPNLVVATYRKLLEAQQLRSLVVNEAISNYGPVWEHLEPSEPGSALSSGASSLGWALGAAIGAKMAAADYSAHTKDVVTVFVGDGSFIFGVPSASYWMARRYETPFLCIVFNNGGWKSPKLSMLGVHPSGLGASGPTSELNVTFGPEDSLNPDYGGIAAASGGAWSRKVKKASELQAAMEEALRVVREDKRCAVLDCWLPRF
ncbi:Thiamin diphosphate-binding protein [Rhodotorula sp. JG-1b]|nr:Thiamin diphosphate-binding protein [Rhodotorula sp. JG-1b]